jgi:hypothetical protein
MARPAAKFLTGFFIVAVLLVVAAMIFALRQPPPAPPPLPKPNGYDDLVQAGTMLAENTWDFATMSEEDLRTLVTKNTAGLKLARTGLSRVCQVPLDYSGTNASRSPELAKLKRLARALEAEGRLAKLENRPADAAAAYLTVIRLGSAIRQGGTILDSLVGIAVEAIGTAPMEKLAPGLDAKQCREIAAALESCETRREPIEALWARERLWARRAYGLRGQIVRLVQFRSLKQTEQGVTAKLTAQQTRARRLLIELAARAYELEKGERPKNLTNLVPAYLKTIPQDPLTGTNMAYP